MGRYRQQMSRLIRSSTKTFVFAVPLPTHLYSWPKLFWNNFFEIKPAYQQKYTGYPNSKHKNIFYGWPNLHEWIVQYMWLYLSSAQILLVPKNWFSLGLMIHVHEPCQVNLVLTAYASSEGSGEPAHPHSLARTFAACSYKQRVKRNLQTESQVPGPSEWLGMRS